MLAVYSATMARWHHAIFSAYGFWLPNDPRGSWSTFVASYELYRYGPATKTDDRRSLAHDPHNAALRREAKQKMKYPPVRFTEPQRDAIARGIAQTSEESAVTVHACAIGHDHVHVVLARHEKPVERIVGQFKGRANQHMKAAGCHPFANVVTEKILAPSPWSEGCWKVFISDESQLRSAIGYVERHSFKEGLGLQRFDFIRPV